MIENRTSPAPGQEQGQDTTGNTDNGSHEFKVCGQSEGPRPAEFLWPANAPLCARQIDGGPETILEGVPEEEWPGRVEAAIKTIAAARFSQRWSRVEVIQAIMEWAAAGLDYPLSLAEVRALVAKTATGRIDCQESCPAPEGYCEKDNCTFLPAAVGGAWFDSEAVVSGVPITRQAKRGPYASKDKETQPTILVRLVEESEAELWHTPSRESYITVNIGDHRENYLLGSQAARDWISRLFYLMQGKSPASQSLHDALGVLRGQALFDGAEHETYCRLACREGQIYIDLGRPGWEAVEVSAEGWRVIPQAPVKFIRSSELLPMPLPERGGQWDELRGLVNAGEQDTWILMISWLMQAFWPSGPYTHLLLVGEQGSIKSTVSTVLLNLVSPAKGCLGKRPKDAQGLLIRASWNRVVGIDNLSGVVDKWFSDTLCGISTGTAIGQRRLYTDFDQVVLEVKRPILMNGIDVIIPRGDLADRTVILELPRIADRELAKKIEAKFKAAWPRIFGLLLDATAEGLRNAEKVVLSNLPRMADFAAWVMACEPALPWEQGEFMAAYTRNQQGRALEQVMLDAFTREIYNLAHERTGPTEIEPAALLSLLEYRAGVGLGRFPPGWPADPARLGTKIRRVAPILRSVGVHMETVKGRKRLVRLCLGDGKDGKETVSETVIPASSDTEDGGDGNFYLLSLEREKGDNDKDSDLDNKDTENTVSTVFTVSHGAMHSDSEGDGNNCLPSSGETVTPLTEPYEVVRILSEVGQFVGVDARTHGPFKSGDVASLPQIHAYNLVRSGVACLITLDPAQ